MSALSKILVSLGLLSACIGCDGTSSAGVDGDDHHASGNHDADRHDSDHHDDDEHEHHHHHEAEHRPDDFPDAVRAALSRHHIVLEELEEGHVDHLEHEFEELLDVIDWLPEFAADSDMRREPWDRVHDASRRLRASYVVVEGKLAAGETPTLDDVNTRDAETALAELQSLIGTEKGDSK